ncbi:MAG: hypothetical protein ACFFD1_16325 [Candidatus Thorarchaeota archaeon]
MKENGNSPKKREKLTIISEMDELKVIANNHLLMKRYPEAIKAAEKIINLALEVKMDSIIREQEEFITNLYKIVETDKLATIILDDFDQTKLQYENFVKKNKFQEAHNMIQRFKEKYDEHYELTLISSISRFLQEETKTWDYFRKEESSIRLLEPLEIQFNSYIHTNNIPLARDTLEKAKKLLNTVRLDYMVEKWKNFESEYKELYKDYQLKEDFDSKIDLIAELTEKYKFQEAHSLLSKLIKIAEERDFSEYKDSLAAKKRNIEDAEAKYTKLLDDIADLEINFKQDIENDQLESAKAKCDQIIKIARFIGKQELISKYEKKKDIINEKFNEFNRFLDFKADILKLSESAVIKIKDEHFIEAIEKYRTILHHIQEYLEE